MGNQNPYLTIVYLSNDNSKNNDGEHKQVFTFSSQPTNQIQISKNHVPWITVAKNTWIIQDSPNNLSDKDYQILYLLKKHYRKFQNSRKKGYYYNSFQTITDLDLKRAQLELAEEISPLSLEHLDQLREQFKYKRNRFGKE